MSIFRTIAMFIYLFGYMIVHYGVLRRAERALAAGDMQLVEELVNKHIPHWSRGILKVTGVSLSVEGLEHIPKDTTSRFCWPVWISPTASLPRKNWKRSRC